MIVGIWDVPALLVLGALGAAAYQRSLRQHDESWYIILTAAVVGVFWLNATATSVGSIPYWLVGTTAVVVERPIAIPYLLSYPFWFRAGGEFIFLLLGRAPDQGGLLWVFRLADRTAPVTPSWGTDDDVDSDETQPLRLDSPTDHESCASRDSYRQKEQ